jgi:hypothetical protein
VRRHPELVEGSRRTVAISPRVEIQSEIATPRKNAARDDELWALSTFHLHEHSLYFQMH